VTKHAVARIGSFDVGVYGDRRGSANVVACRRKVGDSGNKARRCTPLDE
jgi:hypothetical protein